MQEAIEASMTTGPASSSTAVGVAGSPRGQKREAAESANDAERVNRCELMETKTRGTKRKDEDGDDNARFDGRSNDMSNVEQETMLKHPGPIQHGEPFTKGELWWQNIASGIFARTFPNEQRLRTTSESGPPMCENPRRVICSLSTGRVLDDCVADDVPDAVLGRFMERPDDI